MENLLVAINKSLNEVLSTSITVTENTDFNDDLDLDSVLFVQFLLLLEDQIPGLMFEPDQINQDAFTTVGKLMAWISEHLDLESADA
ncbi:phosphopantetheine-containing protein [Dickeya sp. CFBP 2040]|uniref:phosphopantetheine-binding protein n=1 Tax=Dickeya sp. CFBP 2040 TaxID=2718531 RepID=UPI0014454D80|nr:phosphopantetheine-binding protein [Dickeya sp. CFBP 2040]NKI73704.1 phosphopantetheine-containing protein [Dickeya sp. CFBP 2040]